MSWGAYFAKGKWGEAISDFTRTIQLEPTNAAAYFNRGSVYRSAREFGKVIPDVNESLKLNPTNDLAYKLRASIYSFRGEFRKAIADWNDGLRLNPKDANSLACRGTDYFNDGQFDKAVQDYREAIQFDSKNDLAYNNLAWLRATCPEAGVRNGQEAVELATKACVLTNWKRWEWVETLAASYAEKGDFTKAIKYQKQAMSIGVLSEADHKEMTHQLSLYESRHPNHQGQQAGRE